MKKLVERSFSNNTTIELDSNRMPVNMETDSVNNIAELKDKMVVSVTPTMYNAVEEHEKNASHFKGVFDELKKRAVEAKTDADKDATGHGRNDDYVGVRNYCTKIQNESLIIEDTEKSDDSFMTTFYDYIQCLVFGMPGQKTNFFGNVQKWFPERAMTVAEDTSSADYGVKVGEDGYAIPKSKDYYEWASQFDLKDNQIAVGLVTDDADRLRHIAKVYNLKFSTMQAKKPYRTIGVLTIPNEIKDMDWRTASAVVKAIHKDAEANGDDNFSGKVDLKGVLKDKEDDVFTLLDFFGFDIEDIYDKKDNIIGYTFHK